MNFLGHLYFSGNDPELQIANLYGDFVKGSDLTSFPSKVREGIQLHRQIDHYIDQHPKVRELLHQLYPHLPKVSGIAVDLFFDHLLAKNWSRFHSQSLREFTSNFYLLIPHLPDLYPLEFRYVLSKMEHDDWLFQYNSLEGLSMACTGLSRRIRFENNLSYAPSVFMKFETLIEQTFNAFMIDANLHFKDILSSKKQ